VAQSTQSLLFSNAGGKVKATAVTSVVSAGTIVFWFKVTTLTTIIFVEHATAWRCQMTGGGNPRFFDGANDNTFSTLTAATGAWYSIAYKWSGTTAKVFLRPSGGSESSESKTLAGAPSGSPTTFIIGDDTFSSFAPTGNMDHIQLYNSALADATISGLLTGVTDPATLSPTLYWKLEEGSGTTTADSSGSGFTGTLTGPAWSAVVPTELAGGGAATVPNRIVNVYQAVMSATY
jgi:hypothetical protein